MTVKDSIEPSKGKKIWLFVLKVLPYLFFVSLVLTVWWCIGWYYPTSRISSETPALLSDAGARGVFGDQFGAVNALFSGLAFTGVIITLILQQKEIHRQAISIQRQQFESGFFHLLALHSGLIDQLDLSGNRGRQAFEAFLSQMQKRSPQLDVFEAVKGLDRTQISGIATTRELNDAVKEKITKRDIETLQEYLAMPDGPGMVSQFLDENHTWHLDAVRRAYVAAHIESREALSHYFRTLYHILRYVDDSLLISTPEKQRYAKLVGAQLSGMELAVIFYNSLVNVQDISGRKLEFGYPSMFRLVKKYELDKHLNVGVLFHPIHHSIFKSLEA